MRKSAQPSKGILTKSDRRRLATHMQDVALQCLNRTVPALSPLPIFDVKQLLIELWIALYGIRYLQDVLNQPLVAPLHQIIDLVYGASFFSQQEAFRHFSEETLHHWHDEIWKREWGKISIDAIGICYEQGLDQQIGFTDNRYHWAKSTAREKQGAYFTPPQICDFMVKEAMAELLPEPSLESILALRICDPAMGAGAFLRAVLLYLIQQLDMPKLTPELQRQLVTCFAGVDLDKNAALVASLSMWLTLGAAESSTLHALRQRFVAGDALLMDARADCDASGWRSSFPKVFERGGFDLIIGNPPYLSAMTGGISKELKLQYRANFPRLSGRADLSAYFWDLATRLCRVGGYIGLVLPRALLGASACQALRRPGSGFAPRLMYSPEHYAFFDDVNIKVVCLILGPQGPCRISNSAHPDENNWHLIEAFDCPWEYAAHNWWAPFWMATAQKKWPDIAPRRLGTSGFDVRAGIGPVDFYKLPLVDDETGAIGPKLIVSGLIDPDRCDWGTVNARYKGLDFQHPCVDISAPLSTSLQTHIVFATRPKLILANLVSRIECMLDAKGEYIGATATYCIFEENDKVDRLRWLCQLLHRPESTLLFQLTLGANAMHSNLSIRSDFLKAFPLPPEVSTS